MGGSSKKVTVGYKYYLGMHMVLCHGPADKLVKIQVDKRDAWLGDTAGGQIYVNAPSLFGGEEREGGVRGYVDIEMGEPTQDRNDYLQARLGTDIPAFRGVVSAVLRQVYLGVNPYLKAWAFRLQRIHKTSDGSPQWYDGAAEIYNVGFGFNAQVEDFSDGLDAYTLMAGTKDDFEVVDSSRGRAMVTKSVVGGSGIRRTGLVSAKAKIIRADFRVDSRGNDDTGRMGFVDSAGNTIFYFIGSRSAGEDPQRRVHVHSAYISGLNSTPLDYVIELGEWYTMFAQLDYEAGTYTANLYGGGKLLATATGNTNLSNEVSGLEFGVDTNSSGFGQTTFANVLYADSGITGDMNPAHIIRECLTNEDWGMGYLEADIDDNSFSYAADTLFSEAFGVSILWDRQMPIEDFISEIIRHIDATLYVDRVSGKFVLKLIRADYDESTLLELDETNITKVSDYNRVENVDGVNSVTVNFWDSTTGETASVTADDVGMIQAVGTVNNTTVQYPGVTNRNLAVKLAQRDLRSLSSPLLSCTIVANREAAGLNIGDAFKFYWPDYHDGYVVMRVNQIGFGDGKSNAVKITASEDVYAMPEVAVITEDDAGWEDPSAPPEPCPDVLAFESPYYELVQQLGQTDVDNQLSLTPEIGYLQVAASRAPNGISARVWVDDGSGYEDSSSLDFCPSAELSTAVGKGDTTFNFTNGSDLDQVEIGSVGQIGSELFRVDSLDTGTGQMTVGRAVMDSIPEEHAVGASILFWDNYSASDNTEYVSGETLNVKVLPNSGQGSLTLPDVLSESMTMNQRAVRPYRPAGLAANGDLYPDESTYPDYPVTITWTERNRLQETAGTTLDWEDATITPEVGVDYRFEVDCLDENMTLLGSLAPATVAGTTKDVTEAEVVSVDPATTFVRVRLTAQRDGLDSWASPTLLFRGPFRKPTGVVATYRDPQAPTNINLAVV